jgi:hypothetical protein
MHTFWLVNLQGGDHLTDVFVWEDDIKMKFSEVRWSCEVDRGKLRAFLKTISNPLGFIKCLNSLTT